MKKPMNADAYTADPCGASSLSFRKTNLITVPENIMIVRDDAFQGVPAGYSDTVFFKMIRRPDYPDKNPVPEGFSPVRASLQDFAEHICECYDEESASPEELAEYRQPDLRIALKDDRSGRIAASGIAGLDSSVREGTLEWIQVSPDHRRCGLGRFIVSELLSRMKGKAAFVTVSGRYENPTDPFALYKSCGFRDPVFWHVMRRIG